MFQESVGILKSSHSNEYWQGKILELEQAVLVKLLGMYVCIVMTVIDLISLEYRKNSTLKGVGYARGR